MEYIERINHSRKTGRLFKVIYNVNIGLQKVVRFCHFCILEACYARRGIQIVCEKKLTIFVLFLNIA